MADDYELISHREMLKLKEDLNRLKQGNIQIGTTENRVIYFLLHKIVRNSMESYSKIQ